MGAKGFNNLSDEAKNKINTAIELSGLTDKEWIERATDVWTMHVMKSEIPEHSIEIEEVEGLTNRIRSIFVNLAQRTHVEKETIRQKNNEEIQELQQQIVDLNLQLQAAARETKLANDEVQREKELRVESEKYAQQAQENNETNKKLVDSYRDKNDTLTGLVNQYKAGYEASNKLQIELTATQQRSVDLERELLQKSAELEDVVEKHKENTQTLIERKEIEYEREMLKLRTEFQNQITEASTRAAAEVRDLYERLESQRKEYERMILEERNKSVNSDKKER